MSEDTQVDSSQERDSPTVADPESTSPGLQERGIPSVNRVRSVQSRVTGILAIGFMCAVGAGMLAWYYARAFHSAAPDPRIRPNTTARAQTDVGLPPLGPIRPAPLASAAQAPAASPVQGIESLLGPRPPDPLPTDAAPLGAPGSSSGYVESKPAPHRNPRAQALERRLGGAVSSSSAASPLGVGGGAEGSPAAPGTAGSAASPLWVSAGESGVPISDHRSGGTSGLHALLTPDVEPAVAAHVLPTQRFLLPQGAFIDCTLETALDSTLPGMTTCITATDTFSVDGQVVLLERGTKLVGETRGQVEQGQARVFVLWTLARTPTGVVIPLASPGTDELGRAGLPGRVDRHFLDRFGAALLVTVIDGAVQRAATPSNTNGSTVILNPSTSEAILTETLHSTINIPPTVHKDQGDRIQVLVARDLDFRSVYDLRLTATTRQPQ